MMNFFTTLFNEEEILTIVDKGYENFNIRFLFCNDQQRYLQKVYKFMCKLCGQVEYLNLNEKTVNNMIDNYNNLYEMFFEMKKSEYLKGN